ncbi:L-serine ammonia-lyase [Luteimicrobium subarcticum]|uniref:L-serine dehydratase n=1 Tax=Luteimicrobium subarcticum TaxID=620910 RepID=A0A2M8WRS2_9MICO|nr:L-serine ammonia-lyase [Luteimicrobium subarcticum]PJI93637.1 L-serine dehydratase [Luteimicrobium subarcticum]
MTVYVSALELFSLGIGPSSSHTVGPLRAGRAFVDGLAARGELDRVTRIEAVLYGSLGATGLGHGTPDALVAGLRGLDAETCDPDDVRSCWARHDDGAPLLLAGRHPVPFRRDDITLEPRTRLPEHPNALTLRAYAGGPLPLVEETWLSVGGGFVRRLGAEPTDARPATAPADDPYAFRNAAELLALCRAHGTSLAGVAREAERRHRPDAETDAGLDAVWAAMQECVRHGLAGSGELPGGLRVRRRAAGLRARLESTPDGPGDGIDWLHAWALAVNEENAAGGRVVTAPTNGAAGVLPAVLHYASEFVVGMTPERVREFLLTATVIGSLAKANASISGAEGGCQAEVGSACAMAAAGLTAVLGGTPEQVENAAEIALEHHLGLTCDPIAGLVQVPCIERNAVAAATAVSAARLATHGDGSHVVSLDAVIETMRQTGLDMSDKYKETSEGGLAVNVVEC